MHAYEMIYNNSEQSSRASRKESYAATSDKETEFIVAVRYGIDASNEAVFEVHLGSVKDTAVGYELWFFEKRVYDLKAPSSQATIPYTTIPGFKKSLPEINEMMTRDAMINKSVNSNVMWWIDIAMDTVSTRRMDKYILGLGLPADSKFKSNFSQFGASLSKSEKSRIYAGNGNTNIGGVSSLTLFAQAIWISGVPLLHNLPRLLDNLLEKYFTRKWKENFKNYYYTRFAFMLEGTPSEEQRKEEWCNAFEASDAIATVRALAFFLSICPFNFDA